MKGLLQGGIWLVMWAVIGYLLLVLVYCLPVDRMQKHLESSVDAFKNGSTTLVKDDTGMWLDYLTDSTILSEAIFQGGQNPFEKAAAVYSNDTGTARDQEWPYQKILAAMEQKKEFSGYARYWHGFLLYIKPLLFFFDYKDILTLNMLAELLLMLWIAQLLVQRNLKHLLIPAALAFGMLTPVAMALCLQYMPCFYVTATACIVLLKYPDFVRRHAGMYFLSIGMATCYFDFLTFPLITLGGPLVLYLLLAGQSWSKGVQDIVYGSVSWGIGYVVFWAEKWVVGSLVLGENLFADAWNNLVIRSSHETEGQTITYLDALLNNFAAYDLRIWKVLFTLLLVVLLCLIAVHVWKSHGLLRDDIQVLIPLLLVACMPFAWYFVTVNHSYIHYGYTHKELMITGWALACATAELFHRGRKKRTGVIPEGGSN